MLSIQKQPKFLRKTMRLPNGQVALVVFELTEINGNITARAVYGKILGQNNVSSNEKIIALPVYFERQTIKPLVSPFFSYVSSLLKDLSFITSQSTRAPNFV
jgi:hypothetical protein